MSGPLLATKLHPVSPPKVRVARERLVRKLELPTGGGLTLISAPAGFGKSTLVGEWLETYPGGVAWVSLDESDNAGSRFFRYVGAALERAEARLSERTRALLETAQPSPTDLVAHLVNDLVAVDAPVAVVFDDYHVIHAEAVHEAVEYLLENLPPKVRLVLITRVDPPFSLPRLRVRGRLVYMGAAELRFTAAETAALLNEHMRIGLDEAQLEVLLGRTEGWVAGLLLAALSLKNADRDAFLAHFSGKHRHLSDYLVGEVLERQSDEMREVLLKTSILERMCAGLCDALLKRTDSQAVLERLERANLFLIPLDDERRWYRYHHLFGELLRHRLRLRHEDTSPLHERASDWLAEHGFLREALHHAFEAAAFERAAAILARIDFEEMYRRGERDIIMSWLDRLPREVRARYPIFSGWLAGSKLATRRLDEIAEHLEDMEHFVERAEVNDEAKAFIRGAAASIRTTWCFMSGDYEGTLKSQLEVAHLYPPEPSVYTNSPLIHAGYARTLLGDVEQGERVLLRGLDDARAMGNLEIYGVGSYFLAQLRLAQGRLRDAETALTRALEHVSAHKQPHVLVGHIPDSLRGVLMLERNRLEQARPLLAENLKVARRLGVPESLLTSAYALARLYALQGDAEAARTLLQDAVDVLAPLPPMPLKVRAAAMVARLELHLGDLEPSARWAASQHVPDDYTFAHSFEHFTLARVLLAQKEFDQAATLLTRKLAYAEERGLDGDALECRMLLALCEDAQGRLEPALTLLGATLKRAEPEGYVRLFVDEGERMRKLLGHAQRRGVAKAYASRLLEAFGPSPAPRRAFHRSELLEPLSERELEVLALIAEGLSNKQIARRLAIAVATVKRHSVNIYGKLGVNSRTSAVAKASELKLL